MSMPTKKVTRPARPIVTEPMLLILHEKHGNLYFSIPDEETLFKVALDIVAKRDKAGYWYYAPEKPKSPSMTEEEVTKLPDGKTKDFARKELAEYKAEKRRYDDEMLDETERKRAIKEKDGRRAYRVLCDHSDGEYQRMTLERFCETYYE